MEENKSKTIGGITFTGDITVHGPMFDIHDNQHVHIGVEGVSTSSKSQGGVKEMNNEQLARAIENCQEYFWGNASYAVVFCICRDEYKKKMSKSDFEEMIEDLPYTKKRSYTCSPGTIANAFCNNRIFYEHVSEWESFNPLPRIIKLRDVLRKALNL